MSPSPDRVLARHLQASLKKESAWKLAELAHLSDWLTGINSQLDRLQAGIEKKSHELHDAHASTAGAIWGIREALAGCLPETKKRIAELQDASRKAIVQIRSKQPAVETTP